MPDIKNLESRAAIGVAALALTVAVVRGGGDDPSPSAQPPASPPQTSIAAQPAPVVSVAGDRLDIDGGEVAPGKAVVAHGKLAGVGRRLLPITDCSGTYADGALVCVLTPGPWEMHSTCDEQPLATFTDCTITAKNTGDAPLTFSAYVLVDRKEP